VKWRPFHSGWPSSWPGPSAVSSSRCFARRSVADLDAEGRVRSRSAPPRGSSLRGQGWRPSRGKSLAETPDRSASAMYAVGVTPGDVDGTQTALSSWRRGERRIRSGIEEALDVAGRMPLSLPRRGPTRCRPRRATRTRTGRFAIHVSSRATVVRRVEGRCLPGGHPAGENKLPPNVPKYPLESSTSLAFS